MAHWFRRIRGAIGMGLTWAVAWAIAGVLLGVSSNLLPFLPWDAFFEVFDAPLPALAIPGFVGGMLFGGILGIAARERSFQQLSVPRFATWGAVGGLLLALVPALLLVGDGAGGAPGAHGLWSLTATLAVPFVLLGSGSAAASLALARRGTAQPSLQAGDDPEG